MKFQIGLYLFAAFAVSVKSQDNQQMGCEYNGRLYQVGESFEEVGNCSYDTCSADRQITAITCEDIRIYDAGNYQYTPQDNTKSWPHCCGVYKPRT